MKFLGVCAILVLALSFYSCGREAPTEVSDGTLGALDTAFSLALNTETLGDIDVPLPEATGIVASGVGMRGDPTVTQPGTINIVVPGDVQIAFLYWEGQMGTNVVGDDKVFVDGVEVTGTLLGGPTPIVSDMWTTSYRADITSMVSTGANSIEISGMEFNARCPDCRNDGASIVVLYDDGGDLAEIGMKDGNDLAFINFAPTRDATVPQTFSFTPDPDNVRQSTLVVAAGSVHAERPNVICISFDGGIPTEYADLLGSTEGDDWDTITMMVDIPTGVSSMTVELKSKRADSSELPVDALPASLVWVASGLAITPPVVCTGEIGDYVWNDSGAIEGIQEDGEEGIAGVRVVLKDGSGAILEETTTDSNGFYLFSDLCAGDYIVMVDETTIPEGWTQTQTEVGPDPCIDNNPNPSDVVLTEDDSSDLCIDFGYVAPCTGEIGDFVWNDWGGTKGIQDDGEEGIAGVRVVLKDGAGAMIAETTTDSNGYYLFSGLCAGDYIVMVDETTIPEGWMQTPTEVGEDRCIDNNPNPSDVVLTEDDSSDLCIDFGYMEIPEGPGTGTPGYWHKPKRWPVDTIVIGGVTYTKEEAAPILVMRVAGDKTINMFGQLVAAKLNVIMGNDDSCIADYITAADAWMALHPLGSGVAADSEAWDVGGPIHTMLDDYNNGLLCAPKRD